MRSGWRRSDKSLDRFPKDRFASEVTALAACARKIADHDGDGMDDILDSGLLKTSLIYLRNLDEFLGSVRQV